MTQYKFQANRQEISKIIIQIENEIIKRGIPESSKGSFLLYSEEILLQLIDCNDNKNKNINVKIYGRKKNIHARFSCSGKELILKGDFLGEGYIQKAEFDDEQTVAISKMILKANSDRINVRFKKGINIAQLNATSKSQRSISLLEWMLAGLILGFIIKLIGNTNLTAASSSFFSMVSTMFMNAVKMLVTPLVFFSIADSITGFSDVGSFGRVGGKVVFTYLGFSVLSLFVSAGVFSLIHPGSTALLPDLANFLQNTETTAPAAVSLKDTITDIVPSGFVSAFVDQNMTQIIFIAILAGLASGKMGQYSEKIQSFFTVGNSLFSQLIAMVVKTLKPVSCCMLADIAISISASSFVQQFVTILCILISIATLIVLYSLFIAIVGKINPFKFFAKFKKAIFVALTTMSSSATIPTSMQCCDDMGISPKVYSFSIPLGATINMNATCIFLMTIPLFIARIMGIQLSAVSILTLGCTILMLAVSSPGIPGAALACLTIIFAQIGIPSGAVGYIIGIYTLVDGILTAVNVMGDSVTTLVVAKSEKMLDESKLSC